MVSCVAFVLSLFVPRLSFFWCIRGLYFMIVAFPGYLYFYFHARETWLKPYSSRFLTDDSKAVPLFTRSSSLLVHWGFHVSSLICHNFPAITKTCLYNTDPLTPHFYIVKLEFTGVYTSIIFLIFRKHIRIFNLKLFIFWW